MLIQQQTFQNITTWMNRLRKSLQLSSVCFPIMHNQVSGRHNKAKVFLLILVHMLYTGVLVFLLIFCIGSNLDGSKVIMTILDAGMLKLSCMTVQITKISRGLSAFLRNLLKINTTI